MDLLRPYGLSYNLVRFLQIITKLAISGSAVAWLATYVRNAGQAWAPNDLDFYVPSSMWPFVLRFVIGATKYRYIRTSSSAYAGIPAIRRIAWLTTHVDSSLTLNFMQSRTENVLIPATQFHSTCVVGSITADSAWFTNLGLTSRGISIMNRNYFKMSTNTEKRRALAVIRKWYERGFALDIAFGDLHECGRDLRCPATLRVSDDANCVVVSLPYAKTLRAQNLWAPFAWSQGGQECYQTLASKYDIRRLLFVNTNEGVIKFNDILAATLRGASIDMVEWQRQLRFNSSQPPEMSHGSLLIPHPTNMSTTATTAPEVLGQIFVFACGDYFGPDNLYRKKSASRHWGSVARGTPELWASRVLRPSESLESFESWSQYVKSSRLRIHIILHTREFEAAIQRPSIGTAGIVDFVAAKSAAFTMLSISTSDHTGCTNFLSALNLSMFTSLERLVITALGPIQSNRVASQYFLHGSTSPPDLRVAGFPYDWDTSAHFVGLTTLALCDLSAAVAPSTTDLYRMLKAASGLAKLWIDNVESAGSVDGFEAIELSMLGHLHYKPSVNLDLGVLMALLRTPKLQHISFVVLAEDDFDILLDCNELLSTAYSLTLDGFHFNEDKIRQLYDATRGIVELDVSSAVREFCTAIDPDSAFWWGIERAYFRDAHAGDLFRLLEPTARPTRLNFLGVYFTRYNLLSTDDEQRVAEEVDEVDFHMRTAKQYVHNTHQLPSAFEVSNRIRYGTLMKLRLRTADPVIRENPGETTTFTVHGWWWCPRLLKYGSKMRWLGGRVLRRWASLSFRKRSSYVVDFHGIRVTSPASLDYICRLLAPKLPENLVAKKSGGADQSSKKLSKLLAPPQSQRKESGGCAPFNRLSIRAARTVYPEAYATSTGRLFGAHIA
ncbi:hypothetical protein K438DRAFT_1766820 [Mycena galopus ATCC 62051]|nr:hypothetical protein K438DRAFT_1766820 [Mycena galopus ATCC 62051]